VSCQKWNRIEGQKGQKSLTQVRVAGRDELLVLRPQGRALRRLFPRHRHTWPGVGDEPLVGVVGAFHQQDRRLGQTMCPQILDEWCRVGRHHRGVHVRQAIDNHRCRGWLDLHDVCEQFSAWSESKRGGQQAGLAEYPAGSGPELKGGGRSHSHLATLKSICPGPAKPQLMIGRPRDREIPLMNCAPGRDAAPP
jgi:hypothetical protein